MQFQFIAAFLFILLSSTNSFGWEYGSRGRTGSDGQDGRYGYSGRDVSVVADGRTYSFAVSGSDGEDGRDGEDGQDGFGCYQPVQVEYNVEGASGGGGGDAGAGGNGGSGGNITVRTDDIGNLSKIFIASNGGRGGRAGRAGNSGRGCKCTYPHWIVRRCTPAPIGSIVCSDYTYFCRDGADGRFGYQKSDGYNGGRGRLTLINTTNPLPVEMDEDTVPFANLLSAEVRMNVNLWETSNGAMQLFAPGSIISDDYTYFAGTRGFTYTFGWNAVRPIEDFRDAIFYLKAGDNGVQTWATRNLWLYTDVERNGNTFKETVTQAMWQEEATKLRFSFNGAEKTFVAVLDDDAHLSDTMATSFEVSLVKYRRFMWNKTLFEGAVPANLVTVTKDQVVVHLGELPELDPTDLEVGNYFYLTLKGHRAFGEKYGADQEFKHEAYIPEKK